VADKPEFVDMISEATRQSRRRSRRSTCGQGKIAPQSLAAGSVGTVARRNPDAVEAQILEIQELELARQRPLTADTDNCGYRTGADPAPVVFAAIAFRKRSGRNRLENQQWCR